MGTRAFSHDSIFIPDGRAESEESIEAMSQDNLAGKVKTLQQQLAKNIKFGQPPQMTVSVKTVGEANASLDADVLLNTPMETETQQETVLPEGHNQVGGLLDSVSPSGLQRTRHEGEEKVAPVKSSSRPKRHHSPSGTIETVNLDAIPLAIARLDNSAAKHKLSVKPKNQRVSKKHRLSKELRSATVAEFQREIPESLQDDDIASKHDSHLVADKPIHHREGQEQKAEGKGNLESHWLNFEIEKKTQMADAKAKSHMEPRSIQGSEEDQREQEGKKQKLEEEQFFKIEERKDQEGKRPHEELRHQECPVQRHKRGKGKKEEELQELGRQPQPEDKHQGLDEQKQRYQELEAQRHQGECKEREPEAGRQWKEENLCELEAQRLGDQNQHEPEAQKQQEEEQCELEAQIQGREQKQCELEAQKQHQEKKQYELEAQKLEEQRQRELKAQRQLEEQREHELEARRQEEQRQCELEAQKLQEKQRQCALEAQRQWEEQRQHDLEAQQQQKEQKQHDPVAQKLQKEQRQCTLGAQGPKDERRHRALEEQKQQEKRCHRKMEDKKTHEKLPPQGWKETREDLEKQNQQGETQGHQDLEEKRRGELEEDTHKVEKQDELNQQVLQLQNTGQKQKAPEKQNVLESEERLQGKDRALNFGKQRSPRGQQENPESRQISKEEQKQPEPKKPTRSPEYGKCESVKLQQPWDGKRKHPEEWIQREGEQKQAEAKTLGLEGQLAQEKPDEQDGSFQLQLDKNGTSKETSIEARKKELPLQEEANRHKAGEADKGQRKEDLLRHEDASRHKAGEADKGQRKEDLLRHEDASRHKAGEADKGQRKEDLLRHEDASRHKAGEADKGQRKEDLLRHEDASRHKAGEADKGQRKEDFLGHEEGSRHKVEEADKGQRKEDQTRNTEAQEQERIHGEELRWQEVDARQTMPRGFTFQVSSGEKQIIFQKVNLSPVTPAKEPPVSSHPSELKSLKPGQVSHELPSSLCVPHTAILVTGAQLCGTAVNLNQIKDTACKSLLGLTEERKTVEGAPPENAPKLSPEAKPSSSKMKHVEDPSGNQAILAEWASIRSKILKSAENGKLHEKDKGGLSRHSDDWTPKGRGSTPHGNLRKTLSANAKFSITPAWQKFSEVSKSSPGVESQAGTGAESTASESGPPTAHANKEAVRPETAAGKVTVPGSPVGKPRVPHEVADNTEGCKFAKDLPSFLVPSAACSLSKATPWSETFGATETPQNVSARKLDKASPTGEENISPFGVKLRRTNYSLRFHYDQQAEQKKKKRYSAGDSFDGVPTPLVTPDSEKDPNNIFLKASKSPSQDRKDAISNSTKASLVNASQSCLAGGLVATGSHGSASGQEKPVCKSPLPQKPALAPKPTSQTPPPSPLLKMRRPPLTEPLGQKQGKADSDTSWRKMDAKGSAPLSQAPEERRNEEEESKEKKSFFPSITMPWRDKAEKKAETVKKDRPVLQSRHSIDGSKLVEKVESAQPLWITLALQKQKGFREQQANREERRQAREAKQAEKLAKENASVNHQSDNKNTNASRTCVPLKPPAQEEKKIETAISRLERREQLKKSNTLPTSVTVEISNSVPSSPLAKEVTKRFSTPDANPVSTEPAWLALAKRKAKAWSDCPQIIK